MGVVLVGITLTFNEYNTTAKANDVTNHDDNLYVGVIGFAGEVGDLVSALKKEIRNEAKYYHLNDTIEEEIGDCLWYVFKIARVASINPATTLSMEGNDCLSKVDSSSKNEHTEEELSTYLIQLAGRFAVKLEDTGADFSEEIAEAIICLAAIAFKFNANLQEIASSNNVKTSNRFDVPSSRSLSRYDKGCPRYERLPITLTVVFKEVGEKDMRKSLMFINDLRFGSPLTDNSKSNDDYRFHDVFHFAYLAVLGWSPVIRALLKLKRKSHPQTDEVEDGARAILIEEGISHLVFKYAEKNHFLRDDKRVDTALLKTIKAMVDGLEVQDRPLALWEKAIKDGFAVFRLLKQHRRGKVLINMDASSITFAKITDD